MDKNLYYALTLLGSVLGVLGIRVLYEQPRYAVVERFGDSLVVTAFEGEPATQPSGIPGDRIPYAPPFGVALAAWDTDEEQREWIRRGAGDNPDRARRLEQVLGHTRERGFDVDWTTPALAQAVQVVATLDDNEMPTPTMQDGSRKKQLGQSQACSQKSVKSRETSLHLSEASAQRRLPAIPTIEPLLPTAQLEASGTRSRR